MGYAGKSCPQREEKCMAVPPQPSGPRVRARHRARVAVLVSGGWAVSRRALGEEEAGWEEEEPGPGASPHTTAKIISSVTTCE